VLAAVRGRWVEAVPVVEGSAGVSALAVGTVEITAAREASRSAQTMTSTRGAPAGY